jgi:demethylmenaquinone methyltransferase/2-methoxy-6-polyprenyl-1,4-benzoquinol methylase
MHGPGDVRFFDRIARLYDVGMPSAPERPLAVALSTADREVRTVLDVAGGTGRASRAVAGPTPVVVDVSRPMLQRAAARGLPAVQADAGRLPVRDGAVDAVLVVDALHHLPDPSAAVREAHRVLGEGGVLVVREFDPGTLRGRLVVAAERLARMDSRFVGPDDLARFLDRRGFDASVLDVGFEYTVAGVKRESK